MKISYTSFSEKGGRMNNEDCRNVVNIGDERKMFIVCDGMGGLHMGAEVSKTVVDVFARVWDEYQAKEETKDKLMVNE